MSTTDETTESIRARAQQAFANHLSYLAAGRIHEWDDFFAEDGVVEFPPRPPMC
jgi:hypothetical protein